jgi:excisionase family DNA binding protein
MNNRLAVPATPSEKLLRTNIAARRLKRSERTLRRWIILGILPAQRVGRRAWGIREPDVKRLQFHMEVACSNYD